MRGGGGSQSVTVGQSGGKHRLATRTEEARDSQQESLLPALYLLDSSERADIYSKMSFYLGMMAKPAGVEPLYPTKVPT